MFKKAIFVFLLLAVSLNAFSAITRLEVNPFLRLGENLTISGDYGTANVLCKFLIKDENNFVVERLSDEYTFADGSFYSERQLVEPPFYRGDDYNVVVTCGTSTDSNTFTVLQPLGFAHPIQTGWEYFLSEENQEAVMFLVTLVSIFVIAILTIVFILKKWKEYAG